MDCSSELKEIDAWIDRGGIEGVAIAPGKNVDFFAVLSLINWMNEHDVYYALKKYVIDGEETETILTELKKEPYIFGSRLPEE